MSAPHSPHASPGTEFRDDVRAGLHRRPKALPCKYFYDEKGSALFDRICELAAYYPTRTEITIMRAHVTEMVSFMGRRARLVELGSGSSTKTRILLEHARDLEAYVPVDISSAYLAQATTSLAREFPHLSIVPICADYTRRFELPVVDRSVSTVVYFPGSTIGNFRPSEAKQFLKVVASLCRDGGGLLIGVDLRKEPSLIEAAYNDPEGVTAAFNLNLLERINRELEGDLNIASFRHHAFYDIAAGRVEMQLISREAQVAQVAGDAVTFAEGEAITTEYSYKYAIEDFRQLALAAGFVMQRVWMDEAQLFSVQYYALGK